MLNLVCPFPYFPFSTFFNMSEPDESDDLKIVKDEDYVTLTTCTPYGINSHRLLIRGTRIDNLKEKRIISYFNLYPIVTRL